MTLLAPAPVEAQSAPAGPREKRAGARAANYGPLGLVAGAIVFNLIVLRAELRGVAQVNDMGAHISRVQWAAARIRSGKLPFDGWYPRLSLGSAFHQYQVLPHIVAGALSALTGIGAMTTVLWSNYLLLAFWPLCVYLAVRLFGFDRWIAGATGVIAPLVVSVTGYGYEHGSYVWRGNGIWAQLWAMWLFPLTLAFAWRAVSRGRGYAVAALFLALTMACHFLTAYLAVSLIGVFVLVEPGQLRRRLGRAAAVIAGGMVAAAWVLVPLLSDGKWLTRSEWSVGTFWFDSYGKKQVVTWLFTGELFDHGRWPVMSALVAVGVVVCAFRFRKDVRSRLLLATTFLGILLFCGRDTVGFILDRLPGGKDLLLHRFIMAVHFGGILLAGVGAAWIGAQLYRLAGRLLPRVPAPALIASLIAVGLVVTAPAWRERARFDAQGAAWIDQQRVFDTTTGAQFTALATEAAALGGGRIYAGSSALPSGKQIAVGQVPGYVYLLDVDVDAVGFMLRTLSVTTDVEVRFDESNPAMYDLFNVRYVILPAARQPAVPATLVETLGQWRLWTVQTTGYLRVVDTTAAIVADRTNLGKQTADFLRSSLPANGIIPVLAFGGDAGAEPTTALRAAGSGPPGDVTVQFDRPDDGLFGGLVNLTRPGVVMLKASYDPRWKVTVDGIPAAKQMLAPGFVGVAVPAGRHRIEFTYDSYSHYLLLFTLAPLALLALALIPRYGGRPTDWIRTRRNAEG